MRKIFYSVSILLAACFFMNGLLYSFSPDNENTLIPIMSSGAPIPTGLRYPSAVGYTKNDSAWVYVFGGLQDGNVVTSNCYRYNVKANTWESIPPLSLGPIWIGCAVRLGNSLYNIGGTSSAALNDAKTRVQKFDINNNTWTSVASMPFGRCFNQAVTYQDSLIYVAGGWGLPGLATYAQVFLYNVYSDTWGFATSMPNPRCGGVLGISNDTLVYVCGGPNWVNPAATNTVYRGIINSTDRSLITWDTTGAVYPAGVRNSISGASWGNGVIVSGGYQVTSVTNQCYVYSPGRNQWTQMPNLLSPKTDHGTASVFIGNVWKFINVSGTSNRSGANSTSVDILTDSLLLVGINHNSNVPVSFSLEQNYPNPFNPVTKINFDLPFDSKVMMIIYDVTGREIKTLVNEVRTAGYHTIIFDGSMISSGIYFYRIIANANGKDYINTKKMAIIK